MKIIKLIIITAIVSCLGLNSLSGQAFQEEDMFISVGYGYTVLNASNLFASYEDEDGFSVGTLGPINLQFERAISEDIGIGIDIGYSNAGVNWTRVGQEVNPETNELQEVVYNYDYDRQKLTINLRGNYHLAKDEVIDPYFGFGLGFKTSSWKLDSNDDNFDGVEFGNFIPISLVLRFGCRFMFSDNIGAFVEGGAGHGIFQGGLSIKL